MQKQACLLKYTIHVINIIIIYALKNLNEIKSQFLVSKDMSDRKRKAILERPAKAQRTDLEAETPTGDTSALIPTETTVMSPAPAGMKSTSGAREETGKVRWK